jgi:hypothetical protein
MHSEDAMTEERAKQILLGHSYNTFDAVPAILAACAEERKACADTVKSLVPYGGQRKLQEEALLDAVRAIERMP